MYSAQEVENRGDLSLPPLILLFSSLLCLPRDSVPHRSVGSQARFQQKAKAEEASPGLRTNEECSLPTSVFYSPRSLGRQPMAQGGAVGRGEEGAPGALGPPQSRVGHPPRGRAWVRSLRQSQEERGSGREGARGREGPATAVRQQTQQTHRQAAGEERQGCGIHRREADGAKGEKEYTDALRNESLSGLDSCLTIVPGARGGEMVTAHSGITAGLWLGKQAEGYHSRAEGLGAQAAQRP